jgi:hypothetical protein
MGCRQRPVPPPGGPMKMRMTNPMRHPFRVPRVEKPRAKGRFQAIVDDADSSAATGASGLLT